MSFNQQIKFFCSAFLQSLLMLFFVLFPERLNAQEQNGRTSYEEYNTPADGIKTNSKAEEIVGRNIKRAYDVLNDYVKDHGEDIADYGSTQKENETRFGHPGPERNPLDRFNGRLDPARSWNEYVMDSRIILAQATFPACMEPRLIAEKKGPKITPHDPGNAAYIAACRANCPDLLLTTNDWQVISYYWPEYQVSVNRAGAQMIDPEIVGENRGPDELYRIPTSISEGTDHERGKQAQLRLLEQMGIPALDSEKFKDPDYHRPAREFHLRQDGELRYPSAMRPNAFWRAADARKLLPVGYAINNSCLFDALDPPTSQRKIVANRYDQGIYAILARYPEVRQRTDEERYKYTSPAKLKLEEYKSEESQFRESLCASWRMGTNPEVYGELGKLGFQQKVDKKYLDYCLPGGSDLSGSMLATEGTPILQADAARVAMAAIYFSSDNGALANLNKANLKTVKYTLYKERKKSKVDRHVGEEDSPGENKSKIVFIDKMQRIYPTQALGNDADGKMGASSRGFRVDIGQRGSQCFRPEDIPNWSSEGKTNKSEWPLGLMGSVEDHYGETRWAIWNRRIVCACEKFGWGGGCLNLNDGDNEESVFAGTVPALPLPEVFKKAIPIIRGLATKTSEPRPPLVGLPGLDLNEATKDSGKFGSGYMDFLMPPGRENDFTPPQSEDPNDYLLCVLAEDREGNQQQEQNQQQGQNNQNGQNGQNGQGSKPDTGGKPPTGGAKPPTTGGGFQPIGGGGKPGLGGFGADCPGGV